VATHHLQKGYLFFLQTDFDSDVAPFDVGLGTKHHQLRMMTKCAPIHVENNPKHHPNIINRTCPF